MELDFDKEINALLRQAARSGEFVSANSGSHLDADEISAFAENALPEKTRQFYIKHFADCDRCRTILSNTILLNTEAEVETASSVVAAPVLEIAATKIPWYRKMFLMPNLAYTMGGLVLIFGGMLGFLILQSTKQSGVSDVSQMQKEESRANGPNASEPEISYNSNAVTASNSAVSNSANAAAANTNSTAAASNTSANSMANVPTLPVARDAKDPSPVVTEQNQTPAKQDADNGFVVDGAEAKKAERKEEQFADKNKDDAELARNNETAKTTAGATAPSAPKPMAGPPPATASRSAEDETAPREKRRSDNRLSAVTNAKQIGGKTFNRVGGVWIDSEYNKYDGGSNNARLPRTLTIQRGSNEYQKLDKQVRIIAESLDGAIIIVWKTGAYRIQ